MTRLIEGRLYRVRYEGDLVEFVECDGLEDLLVYAANKIRNERRLIISVNEVLNDGRTPKVRLHTDKKFKKNSEDLP